MPSPFIDHLARRVLVFDGAMGTSLHKVELDLHKDYCGCENCVDILAKTRPDVVQAIHESFLEVGADAVETDSFGGARHVLAEFQIQDQCFEINKCAAEVARAACDKHSTKDKPRFAAGSMGPGTKLITLNQIDWDKMFESYREQARGLIAGGVDVLIIETCQDLLQTKCAINAAMAAIDEKGKTPQDIPIMVSVTIETTGTMLLGTEIAAAATALAGYPILSLGLNCATGPTEMSEHIHYLGKHWGTPSPLGEGRGEVARNSRAHPSRYISCLPNAGLPILHEGRTEYPLKPGPFVEAMTKFIEKDGVRIVGGCCGTTPEHIKQLAQAVEQLNSRSGHATASLSPKGWSEVAGGGAQPRQRQSDTPGTDAPTARTPKGYSEPPAASTQPKPGVTSLYSVQDYRQDTSILIIGERMNASGSRAFKRLLEAEDFDGIVSLAREQVRHDGAHVLDLNVDYAGRDNAKDAAEVVRRVVRQVNAPLMLDSTQLVTLESGLKCAGGKCIINSANFEDGEHKFDQICTLAKKYGAALVVGSIDEDKEASMARTADRKLAIALRAHKRATEVHGLAEEDLLFDPLVLPISTGMESDRKSALETIEGVRRISKSLPNSQTTVGLSNVSFGLKPAARVVLNSVFLHELTEAGLTSAILHFSKILPKNKIPEDQWSAAQELVYDKRREGFDPLQAFIELFKDIEGSGAAKKEKKQLSLEESLRAHIIDGEKEGLAETLKSALEKYKPLDIINDHLLDGMKTVGELFGSGQMQLPFVLQSAEVMKMAVAQLEPLMEKAAGQSKGKIVLATVKGDVHDIGKNLVDIILTNNGYSVVNLGIKQPITDIVKAWREHKADAIGMSGLLVKSVNVMEDNLKELNDLGIDAPVVLGGAALTRHYCEGHLRQTYKGPCIYGKDAFDGLRIMDHVTNGKTASLIAEAESRQSKRTAAEDQILKTRIEKLAAANSGTALPGRATVTDPSSPPANDRRPGDDATTARPRSSPSAPSSLRSEVSTTNPVPTPPFLGSRVVTDLNLDDIYPFINPIALFRGQWQVKKGALSDDAYDAMLEDKILPIFEGLKAKCRDEKVLQPKVVYGYYPCNSDGNDLIIWDPTSLPPGGRAGEGLANTGDSSAPVLRELDRLTFPRQPDKRRLCISDFFRPISSGELDYIGLHCVTVGSAVSEAAQQLFKANKYTDYLYLHGLGVETAEALAEYWHKRMRQELSIANEDSPKIKDLFTQHYRGSRYSFGYPACPDMSHQANLFRLLQPERIGCNLTENWQIDPEQSTSAIIVHHPEAKYFNV
jgi:5-methyltetrahydrofolate--homocysteine methyltransferase